MQPSEIPDLSENQQTTVDRIHRLFHTLKRRAASSGPAAGPRPRLESRKSRKWDRCSNLDLNAVGPISVTKKEAIPVLNLEDRESLTLITAEHMAAVCEHMVEAGQALLDEAATIQAEIQELVGRDPVRK